MRKKIICVDFDGVIHSYTTRFKGDKFIPDKPVEGAIPWLNQFIQNDQVEVVIFSTRAERSSGRDAIRRWLTDNGLPDNEIKITATKPLASVFIDDRAFRFMGTFPKIEQLLSMKPWNK